MKKNRAFRNITLMALAICSIFCAQSSFAEEQTKNSPTVDKKIKVVVTTFPIYDYLREIIGTEKNNIDLSLIINNGIDLHNFQPSAKDIAHISTADVFIYNGGESDIWVKEVLSQAMNKKMKIIDLMTSLGPRVKKELIVEGMEEHNHAEHAHHNHAGHAHTEHHDHTNCDHASHAHTEHQDHDVSIYDEHVWLSLKNTIFMCQMLAAELQSIDTTHAAQFAKNAQDYTKKLSQLDTKYQAIFKNSPKKTVLFADRFPFRYLLDDYNIAYFAAFPGCSAETEASFETVIFLSKKITELNLQKILIIDDNPHTIAQAVIRNSKNNNVHVLSLDSLQTVTDKELAAGISYISIMEKNLKTLQEALQ